MNWCYVSIGCIVAGIGIVVSAGRYGSARDISIALMVIGILVFTFNG